MGKLVFKASEVKRAVEHAIQHEGELILAHDCGVYLMSGAGPRDISEDGVNIYVVYAKGCHPTEDADWYDTARDLVGGDDFGAHLPTEFAQAIKEQIDQGAEEITLNVSSNQIKLAKPKVTAIRKCSKCERLLKKQDVGDVCPKCKEAETHAEDVKPAGTQTEEVHSEQLQDQSTDDQSEEKHEDHSDDQPEDKPQDQPQDKSDDKQPEPPAEPKVKPGQAIRDKFQELMNEGKITEEVMNVLTDKEGTAKAFGVRYAFLKAFDPNVSIKELTYINGSARYTSKPIEVNGKQYLVTNDLYKQTVPKFMAWSETL